jgi:cob(I)alamin adenosyltransferase
VSDEEERRHKERAQMHKVAVDAKIAAATRDKGLLLVLTGNGKGKSSSAFGMVARTLGGECGRARLLLASP